MALCVLWTNRLQGRLWWRDALLIWLIPSLFFVVYRLFLMKPEVRDMARFETDNWWMTVATLAGILLTLALARMTRKRGMTEH